MNKVKKLTVALLVLVIGLFAGFTLVGCGDDAPTVTDLSEKATLTVADITYGETPTGVVTYGEKTLVEGKDYDIEFGDYSQVANEVIATVTFKGKYKGSVTDTYAVKAYNVSAAVVTLANADEKIVYTQNPAGAIPSGIVVTYGGQTVDASNYDVAYSNQYAVGTATATVTFKGNYAGTATLDYTIEPFKVTADNAEFTIEDITVGETPNPVLVVDGYVGLMPRVDFDVEFGDYEKVSDSVTATVTFKGNYSGTLTATYKVGAINASQATFTVADIEVGKTPTAVVELSGYTLVEGTDYEINYGNYSAIADEVTATLTFKGNYSGTLTTTYKVKAIDANSAVVALADPTAPIVYNGNPYMGTTVDVVVTLDGQTVDASNYDVAYSNQYAVGTATATVTFKGNYAGSATLDYTIEPFKVTEDAVAEFIVQETIVGEMPIYQLFLKDYNNVNPENPRNPVGDYTVEWGDYNNVGTATLTVNFKGNFSGTLSRTYTVNAIKVDKPTLDATEFIYSGKEQTYTITENAGYTISGNLTATNAGTENISVVLNKNYVWTDGTSDSLTFTFVIKAKDASEAIFVVEDTTEGAKPVYSVTLDGFTLIENTDYTVTLGAYDSVSESEIAKVVFSGNFTGELTDSYAVKSIGENIEALLDFNYDIADRAKGKTVEMYGTNPVQTYVDGKETGAIALVSGKTTAVKVNGVSFGTNDFTVAMDVKLNAKDFTASPNEWNALIESSEHLAYECKGKATAGCTICNGTEMPNDQKDLYQVSVIKESSAYKVRVAIAGENMKYTFTSDEAKAWITPNNGWFNIALVVDRAYEVSETTDTTKVTLYINGEEKTSKNFTLTTTQVLGGDEIYLGGSTSYTSGGVSQRERTVDNFVAYNGILNGDQLTDNLPAYITVNTAKNDWTVEDRLFFIKSDATTVSTEIEINGTASTEGIAIKNALEGTTLTAVEGKDRTFLLTFDSAKLSEVQSGTTVTFALNGLEKTISLKCVPLEAIYISNDISFYDVEVKANGISKAITITGDEAGKVGVPMVTFKVNGEVYDKIIAGENDGEYALTLTAEEANAITDPITVTATIEEYSATFTITKNVFANKITASFSTPNGTGMNNDVAGSNATLSVSQVKTVTTKAIDETPTYATALGAEGKEDGGLKTDVYSNYYEVQNFTGHQDNAFAVSLDVNIQSLATNDQGNTIFATEGSATANINGFHVSFGKWTSSGKTKLSIRYRINNKTVRFDLASTTAYDAYVGKYVNWTFVFVQTNATTISISWYLNYELMGTKDCTVTEGYKLAQTADEDYMGFAGVYGEGVGNTGIQDGNKNHPTYIDNIVLFNDALDAKDIWLIGEYNARANERANIA